MAPIRSVRAGFAGVVAAGAVGAAVVAVVTGALGFAAADLALVLTFALTFGLGGFLLAARAGFAPGRELANVPAKTAITPIAKILRNEEARRVVSVEFLYGLSIQDLCCVEGTK